MAFRSDTSTITWSNRRRRQVLDDETVEPFKPDTPESENAWVIHRPLRRREPETSEAVISNAFDTAAELGRTVSAVKGRAIGQVSGAESCSGIADALAFSSRGRIIRATMLVVAPG